MHNFVDSCIVCAFVKQKTEPNMRKNDFLTCGEYANCAYTSPQVQIFTLRSEGVLCQSYGEPGAPGNDLETDNEWDL